MKFLIDLLFLRDLPAILRLILIPSKIAGLFSTVSQADVKSSSGTLGSLAGGACRFSGSEGKPYFLMIRQILLLASSVRTIPRMGL